jgi:hypothetical protein
MYIFTMLLKMNCLSIFGYKYLQNIMQQRGKYRDESALKYLQHLLFTTNTTTNARMLLQFSRNHRLERKSKRAKECITSIYLNVLNSLKKKVKENLRVQKARILHIIFSFPFLSSI